MWKDARSKKARGQYLGKGGLGDYPLNHHMYQVPCAHLWAWGPRVRPSYAGVLLFSASTFCSSGWWLLAEGEMLLGSSCGWCCVHLGVYTIVFEMRTVSLQHGPPSAGARRHHGCLASCWPQTDPVTPESSQGDSAVVGPGPPTMQQRQGQGWSEGKTRGGSLRPLDQSWLYTGAFNRCLLLE